MTKQTTARRTKAQSSEAITPTRNSSRIATASRESMGINLPEWDVNSVMPTDLYSVSSSLPETDKAEADAAVESIERQRNTVRIVRANIELGTDLIQAATAYRKMEGAAIDYAIEGVKNETKAVRLEMVGVQLDTENQKLLAERERFNQAEIRTSALVEMTEITRDEWEQRKALSRSKVDSLRLAVQQADSTYQQSLKNLLAGEEG